MASALLLSPQPQEALPYLESVAEVCEGDDALSWNLGLARGAAGQWEEAARALQAVQVSPVGADAGRMAWACRDVHSWMPAVVVPAPASLRWPAAICCMPSC